MNTKRPEKEVWEPIEFDFEYTNTTHYEVSNLGRVRSFNKISNGNILKGSKTEGYRIIRLRLFRPVGERELEHDIDCLKEEISGFYDRRRQLKRQNKSSLTIRRLTGSIERREGKLRKLQKRNLKKRTIHHHFLIHRLVAEYFLPAPNPDQSIVAHLDYDKLNNNVGNLKWMDPEEHQEHIRKSPYVIAEKKERKYKQKYRERKKGGKLDSTQVIHIKKLLKRGWTLKKIAKQFNVSDMQIHRIKTGENWSRIKIPN